MGSAESELTRRAITQATRLGAEVLLPRSVSSICQKDGYKKVILDNGEEINTHAVVITTGVDYRKLRDTGHR